MNPSRVIVVSVVVIAGTTIIRRVRTQKTLAKGTVVEPVVFGFMLMSALLILSVLLPTFALMLAYLGLLGAFVVNGPELFKFFGDFGRN